MGEEQTRRVGRFELIELLGRGGMGEVWKARDPELKRLVALKLLQRTGREDLARFRREAQAVARLNHPHIAQLYEFSAAPPYLSMQLVDGEPIDAWSGGGIESKAAALRDAARAVHHANEAGVLHRDLKPDNILVDRGGHASVLDFGLAREVHGDATAMTLTGDILGTPSYMAPEQARGEIGRLDARTDVYGLGATLYALLAGRPPHVGPTAFDVIRHVIDDEPTAPEGNLDLRTICMKAIEKEPSRRYGTVGELADDLERYLRGEPIRARPASVWYRARRRIGRHPVAWGLGTLLALTLCGVVTFALGPAWLVVESDPSGARIFVDDTEMTDRTPARIRMWIPRLREVRVEADERTPGEGRVRLRPWATETAQFELESDHGFVLPQITPDGVQVEFRRTPDGSRVQPIPLRDGRLRLPTGLYEAILTREGFESRTAAVMVTPGQDAVLSAALPMQRGRVCVTTASVGASATIECIEGPDAGAVLHASIPIPEGIELSVGHYRLTFELANHFPRQQEVLVRARESTAINATLAPMIRWEIPIRERMEGLPGLDDLDQDGVSDVIVGTREGRVLAFRGADATPLWRFEERSSVEGLGTSDLNRDAVPDVVFGSRSGRVTALSGIDGTPLWVAMTGSPVLAEPLFFDATGDGVRDVFIGSRDEGVWLLNGLDGVRLTLFPTQGMIFSSGVFTDLGGDDDQDLILPLADGIVTAVDLPAGTSVWSTRVSGLPVTGWLAVSDIEQDGAPEVVVAPGGGDPSVVLLDVQDGTILRSMAVGDALRGMALADLDGDDFPDLVTGHGERGFRAISLRTGRELWRTLTGGRTHAPSVLDTAAGPAVIGTCADGQIYSLSGISGTIRWSTGIIAGFAGPGRLADLEGDGSPDYVVVAASGTLYALNLIDDTILWKTATQGAPTPAATGQFRPDPGLEVATCSSEMGGLVLNGIDGATFRQGNPDDVSWERPIVGDMNGDGQTDLVIATREGEAVAYEGSSGHELWRRPVSFTPGHTRATAADFDADGADDLFHLGGGGRANVVSGRSGALLWAEPPAFNVEVAPAVVDVPDGGGAHLFLASSSTEGARIRGSDGTVMWTARMLIEPFTGIAAGDLNGDAEPDMVAFEQYPSRVAARSGVDAFLLWTWEDPTRSFQGLGSPQLGDLNGDGASDAIAATRDGRLVALEGRTGQLLWQIEGLRNAVEPVVSDLEGDGAPEVAARAGLEGLLVFSGHDGSVLRRYSSIVAIDGLGAADVDGDGDREILVPSWDWSLVAVDYEPPRLDSSTSRLRCSGCLRFGAYGAVLTLVDGIVAESADRDMLRWARLTQGDALFSLGRWDEAEEALNQARDLGVRGARVGLLHTLARVRRRLVPVEGILAEAIDDDPVGFLREFRRRTAGWGTADLAAWHETLAKVEPAEPLAAAVAHLLQGDSAAVLAAEGELLGAGESVPTRIDYAATILRLAALLAGDDGRARRVGALAGITFPGRAFAEEWADAPDVIRRDLHLPGPE